MKIVKRDKGTLACDDRPQDEEVKKCGLSVKNTQTNSPSSVLMNEDINKAEVVMDEKNRQIAIQLAKEKIKELEAFIKSLQNGSSGEPTGTTTRRRRRPGVLVRAMIETLTESDSPLTPKELYDRLRTKGIDCSPPQVRYGLRSHVDKHFDNPEYGVWQTIEQKEQQKQKDSRGAIEM